MFSIIASSGFVLYFNYLKKVNSSWFGVTLRSRPYFKKKIQQSTAFKMLNCIKPLQLLHNTQPVNSIKFIKQQPIVYETANDK